MLVKKNSTLLVVDIEEDQADYQIFIDNTKVDFYHFYKHCSEYGYKSVKIVLYEGKIKISPLAYAYYPNKKLLQNNYINWFYSDLYKVDKWYDHSISFYHLYAQGPSYFLDDQPIWDYETSMAGYLNDKTKLTKQIKNMIVR